MTEVIYIILCRYVLPPIPTSFHLEAGEPRDDPDRTPLLLSALSSSTTSYSCVVSPFIGGWGSLENRIDGAPTLVNLNVHIHFTSEI